MSQNAKRHKLAALAERGATEGERQAAAAALSRMAPPTPGTPEWRQEMLAHQKMVQSCAGWLGDPCLTSNEVRVLRNWIRYIGSPWDRGAEEFQAIHDKLAKSAAGGTVCNALIETGATAPMEREI